MDGKFIWLRRFSLIHCFFFFYELIVNLISSYAGMCFYLFFQFIQRRSSASVDFYRTWNEYKVGFEDPTGDHWLGNDHIHSITEQKSYDLRIDLTDRDNTQYYALYSSFSINDETDKYRLSIGSYSGTAGKFCMLFCLLCHLYVDLLNRKIWSKDQWHSRRGK